MVLLAECNAIENDLDPALYCALIDVESNWHPEKCEWQGEFIIPDGRDPDEWYMRGHRWGLTQVLGKDAREAGYVGELALLLEPEINLEWGARVLAGMMGMAGGTARALMLWRGANGNQFPELVATRADAYRAFLAAEVRPSPLARGRSARK